MTALYTARYDHQESRLKITDSGGNLEVNVAITPHLLTELKLDDLLRANGFFRAGPWTTSSPLLFDVTKVTTSAAVVLL